MDRSRMMEAVQAQMPEKRWKHTLGVMQTAVVLAERFGASRDHADTAAILHDVAKYWPIERMKQLIEREQGDSEVLSHDKELWHAEAGALAARIEYDVREQDILNAIRYHTSGRPGMSQLEKIVWLADLIEPGRDFPGVDKIRELAKHNLHEALLAGFDATILFLLQKQKRIFPLTVLARNDIITNITREAVE